MHALMHALMQPLVQRLVQPLMQAPMQRRSAPCRQSLRPATEKCFHKHAKLMQAPFVCAGNTANGCQVAAHWSAKVGKAPPANTPLAHPQAQKQARSPLRKCHTPMGPTGRNSQAKSAFTQGKAPTAGGTGAAHFASPAAAKRHHWRASSGFAVPRAAAAPTRRALAPHPSLAPNGSAGIRQCAHPIGALCRHAMQTPAACRRGKKPRC
jgi:hypothetical protein